MLSMGGRLILVESVLNSMAVHVLASLPTPTGVLDRINSLLSNFIWDSGGERRRHWVSWSDICRNKKCGGLAIRNLKDICLAFQYKLAWRCMDPASLWGSFVRSSYKVGMPGSHIWTYVSKVLPDLRAQCSWNVEKGTMSVAAFCWLYGTSPPATLRDAPMHSILLDQDALTTLTLNLPPHGQRDLQAISISDSPDLLEWCRSPTGTFTTKEFHRVKSSPAHINNTMANIWRPWLPPKLSVFLWKLRHRAVPLDDRVRQCGIALASMCRCCLRPDEESTAHLFFHSDAANRVWDVGRTLLDIPKPHTLRMLWDILNQLSCSTSCVDGLRIVWVCCSVWEIWSLRNARIHGNNQMDIILKLRAWIQRLAPCIHIPHSHCLLHESILKALHLPVPYVPKTRWKKWVPSPTGLTLNAAWDTNSFRGAFVLRNSAGSVLHYSLLTHLPPLATFSTVIRQLGMQGHCIATCQSCHPCMVELHAKRGWLDVSHGIKFNKICTPAYLLASSDYTVASTPFLLALKADRLGLPSPCHACPFHA
ncbi:hypothetical protein QQ045_015683 [Rhodiola kirilowii]